MQVHLIGGIALQILNVKQRSRLRHADLRHEITRHEIHAIHARRGRYDALPGQREQLLHVGRKFDQPLADAYPFEFRYRVEAAEADGPTGFDAIGWTSVGSGVILWIALIAEIVLRKEAMGFGDVKFLGAIGAFLGWEGSLFAIFGGAIIGTFGFAIVLTLQRMTGRHSNDGENGVGFGKQTPFGPMLAAGALLYMLWLHPWVDGYFGSVAGMLYDVY